ncbi:T9SS type A sorting domain-containing protein [Pontibacter sp. G13]|uniref:T9SS type A sorting domain-containing protein n=1 Tax=Pontibacter sp. G13 TaxID=3074898 RepID=UPI002889791E|nr:T9SS type A sorting domain-containing protein [Pontibacter sp. G13]WNJ20432.1 T9SS type A sorting domain-containing protein [Pontibacter sp. G13]
MKRIPLLLPCALFGFWLSFLAPAVQAQDVISIDHKTQRFIGDVSQLDRSKYFTFHGFFGANSTDPDLVNFRNTYNLPSNYSGSRRFWGPLHKVDDDPAGTIPNVINKYDGVRSVDGAIATGTLGSLMNDPNEDYSVLDLSTRSQHVATYIAQSFKDEWDDVPTFYEPLNEPMVHAHEFYPGGWNTAKNDIIVTKICEFHRDLGVAMHALPELTNMKLIGYASAYPSFENNNFDLWQKRYKKFIDIAGQDMDGFSVHLYDGVGINNSGGRRSGSNAEAIMDMIEAYSFEKLGEVKPLAVTEYGRLVESQPGWTSGGNISNYEPVENSQAVRSQIHMVMSFMERAGNMMITVPFSIGKSNPYTDMFSRASLWVKQPDGSYHVTERRYFFEMWKDVKGKRVQIHSSNIDIQTQAFVDGNKLHVVLNNMNDATQTANLNLADVTGLQSVDIKRLKVYVNQVPQFTTSSSSTAPSSLSLEYGETAVLTYTFDSGIEFDASLSSEKYYANATLKPIAANSPVAFTIDNVEKGTGTAILRVGVGRDLGASLQPTITLNGQTVSYSGDVIRGYDQANRSRFFGILEIPVDMSYLNNGTNAITVKFPDNGGHVTSVILQVETLGDPVVPVPGPIVTFQNVGSGKFMSAQNPNQLVTVLAAGATEQFEVINLDGGALTEGFVALKGSNGQYVSSQDGATEMTCTSTTVGSLEEFSLVDQGDGTYAIQGNNGLYLRENMLCTSPSVSTWQKWTVAGLNSTSVEAIDASFEVYPNPSSDEDVRVNWPNAKGPYSIRITDLKGALVFRASGVVGSYQIARSSLGAKGIYLLSVHDQASAHSVKLLVK